MLQIILLVTTITLGGEAKTRGVPYEDVASCMQAAQEILEQVADDFDKFGMQRVVVGCMVRTKANPA